MKLPQLPQTARAIQDNLENAVEYSTAVVRDMTGSLVVRDASSTCSPGSNSARCALPEGSTSTQTLPIVLGAVIPITCAIIVFYILHRRNKKKVALEDINDPHKSLDFGLDLAPSAGPGKKKKGRKAAPEMIVTDMGDDPTGRPQRPVRGLSMDMLGSPYMLPAGLQGSHESLHSMSRVVPDQTDPYRPVAFARSSEDTSRSPRHFKENGSVYSASTTQTGNDRSILLSNAQRMSQSFPTRGSSMTPSESKGDGEPLSRQMTNNSNLSVPTSRKASMSSSESNLPNIPEIKKMSLPPLPSPPEISTEDITFPTPPEPAVVQGRRPPRTSSMSQSRTPPINSIQEPMPPSSRPMSDDSYYGDAGPPPPQIMEPQDYSDYEQYDYDYNYEADPNVAYNGRFSIDTPQSHPQFQHPVQDNRMSFMGLRPLPREDPAESAEQRANRIRSFYKEYFDENRPHPANAYYQEDYDAAYYDGGMFDPETGEYFYAPQAPYAQPMGRRAMTPPPRGAGGPRFAGGDHYRHHSTMSAGGPGQFRGRPAQRAPPKKKLPPPKVLTSLPTPHMLKSDSALMSATDFAPPTSFRELQNGRRPDSPMGIQRPYSPSVKAYSPLVPAFDELSVMPSPHHLRKSGTFTSLDFAALPRFRGQEGTASDAGSIRSARSGISAMQMDAVRSGAYRVSRIPKEMVTTRDDLASQLRPKMNLTTPA